MPAYFICILSVTLIDFSASNRVSHWGRSEISLEGLIVVECSDGLLSPSLGLLPHNLLKFFAETDALVAIVIVFDLELVDLRCFDVTSEVVELLVTFYDLATLLSDRPFIAVVHLLMLSC